MRNFFDSFLWAFLILFSVPTLLIVASWNSLPGDSLFPLKLGLEQSLAFIVSPSYAASGQLQIKYTERRFADAQRSLAERHSVAGLRFLEQQVVTTKTTIERASDTKMKTQFVETYIQTLQDVSAALEQQKQTVTSVGTQVPPQSPPVGEIMTVVNPMPTTPAKVMANKLLENTPSPTLVIATPTPIAKAQVLTTAPVSPQVAFVALQIAATQKTIEQTIKELKEDEEKNEKEVKREIKEPRNEQEKSDTERRK
ncbi:hypothetical protein HY086_03370 [Candidatus Gottesmanbacteria bacterium]|nr:hypothetical protein [Candidatus Gottesmanbacteria bacterium]